MEEALDVMIPVLRGVDGGSRRGLHPSDVTPDNIYITKDGNVKLLDFGSARYSIGDKSKSLDVILKVGYAPKEQYIRRSRQGHTRMCIPAPPVSTRLLPAFCRRVIGADG